MLSKSSHVRHWLRCLTAAAALTLVGQLSVTAQDYTIGPIKITAPWSRATPAAAKVAGGFMVIENTGKESDFLVGGTLVRSGRVEIHEMAIANDIMKMRELPQGLEIKPGEKVTLKPGSYHVMFMELKQPLKEGETIEGTLVFKKAGSVPVTYKIRPIAAKGGGHGSAGGHRH